ncbi:SIR2 family protein [Mycobacterium sp. SMC-18]|uniref:SIR2 family protein n=1 Tax=Mycobacterium TaxID=1763 RepID=UPI000CDE177F|nr:SIR2 family protein [Mycobacterium kansasii]POX75465.1 hypothetical protein C3475_03175 [Mycobacterium kansasii]POY13667.1 hypothetical protein C3474_02505 [Mycobacterium kansasii]
MTRPPTDPADVFVFAGAGLSMSAPTSLPLFDWLRDTLLQALGFGQYVPGRDAVTAEQRRVAGIQPEPFFFALEDAGIDTQTWLARVLNPPSARPNEGHRVVAELCLAGARVWTVNFDTFIERALPGIEVVAAPDEPTAQPRRGQLLKPHGTIGGRLIVTPRETLTPPPPVWRDRLHADLQACAHVVFIGYSGRDFDFRHQWNRVLSNHIVWWFDMPGRDHPYKRHLLREVAARGHLVFPDAQPHRSSGGSEFFNPAWDFVQWCRSNTLIDAISDAQRDTLLADRKPAPIPTAPTGNTVARADVAALTGDVATAQTLLRQARRDPTQRDQAVTRLRTLFFNRPSWQARWITSLWWAIPPLGAYAPTRRRLRTKYLTQLSHSTNHRRVVSLTDRLVRRDALPEAALGLRLAALKMRGDVGEVIVQARRAVLEPRSKNNAVRCNAALHWCHALLWAGHYPDVRAALDDHFRPLANITNTRWMAWADYIEACLLIASAPPGFDATRMDAVTDLLDAADDRFRAEANQSGVADILTVRLTALRQHQQIPNYVRAANLLRELHQLEPMAHFAAQAATIELAQMYSYHLHDRRRGLELVKRLRHSRFPVHSSLAYALSGQWTTDAAESDRLLAQAIGISQPRGLARISGFAADLTKLPAGHRNELELFFP